MSGDLNDDIRKFGEGLARYVIRNHPGETTLDDDGIEQISDGATKLLRKSAQSLLAEGEEFKSMGEHEAAKKLVAAPARYFPKIARGAFGVTLCETIRKSQKERGFY